MQSVRFATVPLREAGCFVSPVPIVLSEVKPRDTSPRSAVEISAWRIASSKS